MGLTMTTAKKQKQAVPADIQAVIATLDESACGSRSCVRCGKELTDAASIAWGIGPVCRRFDNAVLARSIKADYALARNIITANAGVWSAMPETLATVWQNVVDAVNADTTDFRTTVKRIEFILSFHATRTQVAPLHALVIALGYPSVVALWLGETCNGKSFCEFANGIFVLKSPRPSEAVRNKMKAAKGRFNPADKTWFFPAANFEAVEHMLTVHFLDIEGVAAAVEAARSYVAPRNAQEMRLHMLAKEGDERAQTVLVRERERAGMPTLDEAPARPVTFAITLAAGNAPGFALIASPYNATFVQTLKAHVDYQHRQWIGDKKQWLVKGSEAMRVAYNATVSAYGKENVLIKGATPEILTALNAA